MKWFTVLFLMINIAYSQKYFLRTTDGDRYFILNKNFTFDSSSKYPLVFVLHGGGGKANLFDRFTKSRFSELATKNKFFIVYPQGINKAWNDSKRVSSRYKVQSTADDVGFLDAIIDSLVQLYPIDTSKIFVCGISNGGFMSYTYAMNSRYFIKAYVAVAAGMSDNQMNTISMRKGVSSMYINGTDDPIVPYLGGEVTVFRQKRGVVLPVDKAIKSIANFQQLSLSDTLSVKDIEKTDGCNAIIYSYTSNKEKIELILYKIIGGGHTWPGGTQYLPKSMIGNVCNDFNACDLIIDFFMKHK